MLVIFQALTAALKLVGGKDLSCSVSLPTRGPRQGQAMQQKALDNVCTRIHACINASCTDTYRRI